MDLLGHSKMNYEPIRVLENSLNFLQLTFATSSEEVLMKGD